MNNSSYPTALKRRSAQSYADVGLETQVLSASPQELITLLLQGAQAAIMKARLYIKNGDVAGRGASISKAIDIIDSGLKASIDSTAGGELASNLINTYEIITHYLLLANLHADEERLSTAETMLNNIAAAWREATASSTTQTHKI